MYRLIAVPFLLFLIFTHQLQVFRWLLPVSFFTDAIDGFLARRYKVTSTFGSRLDSISDDLTIAVSVIGILIFNPEFLLQNLISIILLSILFAVQVLLALVRYRRITSFHTILAKFAMISQGIFFIFFFFLDQPSYALFYITVIITALDLTEEIALVLYLPEWKRDVKSLYHVMRNSG
jgi:CDP-diacylglycerol--glycerol-3-phosphate 3-phosphatidyltransferase